MTYPGTSPPSPGPTSTRWLKVFTGPWLAKILDVGARQPGCSYSNPHCPAPASPFSALASGKTDKGFSFLWESTALGKIALRQPKPLFPSDPQGTTSGNHSTVSCCFQSRKRRGWEQLYLHRAQPSGHTWSRWACHLAGQQSLPGSVELEAGNKSSSLPRCCQQLLMALLSVF